LTSEFCFEFIVTHLLEGEDPVGEPFGLALQFDTGLDGLDGVGGARDLVSGEELHAAQAQGGPGVPLLLDELHLPLHGGALLGLLAFRVPDGGALLPAEEGGPGVDGLVGDPAGLGGAEIVAV